jgi:hypothetical protein
MSSALDRIVRKPRIEVLFAVFGFLAGMGLSTFMKGSLELHPTLVLTVAFAAAGVWFVRTWRRLWRRGIDQWEKIVFDIGVRLFGPFAWIVTTLVFAIGLWNESHNISVATFFFVWFFFSLPLWLWVGYMFGAAMAAFQRVKRSPGT